MIDNNRQSFDLFNNFLHLLSLNIELETKLTACMYYLNELINSERTSVFIYNKAINKLIIRASLDLQINEVQIPYNHGITGWVFTNKESTVVDNAYHDYRFYKGVDNWTGFHTKNLICVPLIEGSVCLGTLQSINKIKGVFTGNDLKLLEIAATKISNIILNKKKFISIKVKLSDYKNLKNNL